MFRGSTNLSLDSKGRLAIPARYRELLSEACSGRLVATVDPTRCILIYPYMEWEPIEAKLNGLSSFNPQTRALQRLLVGNASELDMDAAGRVLLPASLRSFAGMEKNVVLVGQGRKFELWDEARWAQTMDEALSFAELPGELEGFSL